ncbi:MAG: hypothetical protein BroJett040_15500 [Oligoflexia bacterium]|nr:MAG: hypothetical protein BroJett040_15500 [Oligoflexia bacterium]
MSHPKRSFHFTRQLLSSANQKGMALIMAVFTVVLITYLVTEVTYETNVEYLVNSQSMNRLRAYYAAKSGMELSLLRIKIYSKVQQQFGKQLGPQAKMLDLIWSFPFMWPPMAPDDLNEVDKGLIKDKVKESKMDASYATTITEEGSKIDLNDLASPSQNLKEMTQKRLIGIFEAKKKNDENWARTHQDFEPQKLVNHIIDWIDADQASLNGGDERQYYSNLKDSDNKLPPNRAFRTIEELRLIPGMTEDFFKLIENQVTVYGMKAVNPNHASSEVLQSLDPSITKEVAGEIIKRRESDQMGGHFKDAQDFWGYVNASGGRVEQSVAQSIPLTFDAVYNFRIKSVGSYSGSTREITAIVFDLQKSAQQVAGLVKKENPQPGADGSGGRSGGGAGGTNNSQTNIIPSKGPPRIVYWNER